MTFYYYEGNEQTPLEAGNLAGHLSAQSNDVCLIQVWCDGDPEPDCDGDESMEQSAITNHSVPAMQKNLSAPGIPLGTSTNGSDVSFQVIKT